MRRYSEGWADARPSPLLAILSALVVSASACGSGGPAQALRDPLPTRQAAASAVLDAFWQRDQVRLDAIALSEAEFRELVWPHLPASRPEVGMHVDYLWADTHAKSLGYRAQSLDRWGGERLTLESVAFAGATTDYGPFRVHAGTRVVVRDAAGARHDLRLFGSMIETPDGWKIYSYIVD